MISFSDRLKDSFPTRPSAPRPRTPAQIEASRRNGSRSRGPKTPQGKLKVRQNALAHGLFAKVVRPAEDERYDHETYDELVKQFADDYRPATQLQVLLVETLAADVLYLRRIMHLRELALTPPVRRDYAFHDGGSVERHEAELRELDALIRAFDAELPFDLPASRVQPVAELTRAVVDSLRASADRVRAAGDAAEQAGGSEVEVDPFLLEEAKLYWEISTGDVDPMGLEELTAVLSDTKVVTAAQRGHWLLLLKTVRDRKRGQLTHRRKELTRYHRKNPPAFRDDASVPPLDTLMRAEVHARRAVQHTLNMLMSTASSGRRHTEASRTRGY